MDGARLILPVALLVVAPLAGCLASEPDSSESSNTAARAMAAAAAVPAPLSITLPTTDIAGQPSTLDAMAWVVPDARTAVLLLHGLGGTAERIYHVLPEAGYSLGAHVALTGRTAIAIDLPGYGASPGPPEGLPVEDHARTINQLAQRLKQGTDEMDVGPVDTVVGYGISMGAFVVTVAGGSGDGLDAIVPVAGNHAGIALPAQCLFAPDVDDDCPTPAEMGFWEPNAEASVIERTLALAEPPSEHGAEIASVVALLGGCGLPKPTTDGATCDPYQTRFDELSDGVTVPVLSVVGLKDLQIDPQGWEEEPAHFPNSPDARVHAFEDVGHLVHSHRVLPEVVEIVDTFLDDVGL